MLPNHAPLVIAEQFGTLESLFPGRIDLGLGRAPGTDPATAHALRRTLASDPDAFPQDVLELMGYFAPQEDGQHPGRPRRRAERADLHPRLEHLRRAGRRRAGPAVRVRVALRAGAHDAGASDLPIQLPSRQRNWRSPTRFSASTSSPQRPTRKRASWRRRDASRSPISAAGCRSKLPPPNQAFEKDVVPFGSVPLEEIEFDRDGRIGVHGAGRLPALHRADGARRTDGRVAHLRPQRPRPVVRDRGRSRRRVRLGL